MTTDAHFSALQNMYLAAPINAFYEPRIEISSGQASIEIEVQEKYFHSAGATHGSVYFKMLLVHRSSCCSGERSAWLAGCRCTSRCRLPRNGVHRIGRSASFHFYKDSSNLSLTWQWYRRSRATFHATEAWLSVW